MSSAWLSQESVYSVDSGMANRKEGLGEVCVLLIRDAYAMSIGLRLTFL